MVLSLLRRRLSTHPSPNRPQTNIHRPQTATHHHLVRAHTSRRPEGHRRLRRARSLNRPRRAERSSLPRSPRSRRSRTLPRGKSPRLRVPNVAETDTGIPAPAGTRPGTTQTRLLKSCVGAGGKQTAEKGGTIDDVAPTSPVRRPLAPSQATEATEEPRNPSGSPVRPIRTRRSSSRRGSTTGVARDPSPGRTLSRTSWRRSSRGGGPRGRCLEISSRACLGRTAGRARDDGTRPQWRRASAKSRRHDTEQRKIMTNFIAHELME